MKESKTNRAGRVEVVVKEEEEEEEGVSIGHPLFYSPLIPPKI
jgi:hypothetical protein